MTQVIMRHLIERFRQSKCLWIQSRIMMNDADQSHF